MTRIYGKRYDEKLRTKEIAAILRKEVRLEVTLGLLPKGRWSVTMDTFSMGSSIAISFAPSPEDDEAFARVFYSRERVIFEAENPNAYAAVPFRSEFGAALVRRLERKLADFNHDGSDPMVDHFDVKFHGNVSVRSRTDVADLVALHEGGNLPPEPLSSAYAAMFAAWQKEAMSEAIVTAELRTAALLGMKAGDDPHEAVKGIVKAVFTPAEFAEHCSPTGRIADRRAAAHLRLVPKPSALETLRGMTIEAVAEQAGVSVEEVKKVTDQYREAYRSPLAAYDGVTKWPTPPRARRPIAVPVGAVPQAPNAAWARLAIAEELDLDWAIPGLVLP